MALRPRDTSGSRTARRQRRIDRAIISTFGPFGASVGMIQLSAPTGFARIQIDLVTIDAMKSTERNSCCSVLPRDAAGHGPGQPRETASIRRKLHTYNFMNSWSRSSGIDHLLGSAMGGVLQCGLSAATAQNRSIDRLPGRAERWQKMTKSTVAGPLKTAINQTSSAAGSQRGSRTRAGECLRTRIQKSGLRMSVSPGGEGGYYVVPSVIPMPTHI
jgi:hypothetical protein